MNKFIKIFLIIIGIIILSIVIDLVCIFTINRPIFAIQAKTPYTYTGIFYDTYNCPEYSIPQIKAKGTKFSCAEIKIEENDINSSNNNVLEIVDTSKNNKDFICAQALEEIYQDDTSIYYFRCYKSSLIIVKYKDGSEENVKDALNKGKITISDLDRYGISYIAKIKNMLR